MMEALGSIKFTLKINAIITKLTKAIYFNNATAEVNDSWATSYQDFLEFCVCMGVHYFQSFTSVILIVCNC